MALTKEQVAELFAGYFGRAPLQAGLDYWTSQDMTMEEASQAFAEQEEYKTLYADYLDADGNVLNGKQGSFINAIFQNTFSRDASPDGISYWSEQLDKGLPVHAFVVAIEKGAQGDDKVALENKAQVGIYFAEKGLDDLEQAKKAVSSVDEDPATVTTAEKTIDQWAHDSANYEMIFGKDTWEGTDGDDSVSGTVSPSKSTYQGIDSLDGKGGDDILKITSSVTVATTAGAATVKNIESLQVTTSGTAGTTFNLQNYDGSVKHITVDGNGQNVTFGTGVAGQDFDNLVEDLTIKKTANSTTQIQYEAGAIVGNDDTMDITVASSAATTQTVQLGSPAVGTAIVENLNIHSQGGNLTINEGANVVKNVTIDGNSITLAVAGGTTIANIDAHTMAGALTITAGIATGDGHVQGGTAGDTITGPATAAGNSLTIDGNAGNDTITTGAVVAGGTNTINGGEGNDTINAAAATAGSTININGGAGQDAITAGGGRDILKYANIGDSDATSTGSDTVTAFTSGTDLIDFDTLPAGNGTNFTAAAGAAGFTASMNAAETWFGAAAGRVYYMDTTSNILFVDADGDGKADDAIQFTGGTTIAAADIIQ